MFLIKLENFYICTKHGSFGKVKGLRAKELLGIHTFIRYTYTDIHIYIYIYHLCACMGLTYVCIIYIYTDVLKGLRERRDGQDNGQCYVFPGFIGPSIVMEGTLNPKP